MFRFTVCIVAMAVSLCTSAWAQYGVNAPASSAYGVPYSSGSQAITLPTNALAVAGAVTNIAGAKAAAAKIDAINWDLINLEGYKIGHPLITKNYGPLTSIHAASLPARSFVGKIDPAFLQDSNGKIQFVGGSSIGAVVV